MTDQPQPQPGAPGTDDRSGTSGGSGASPGTSGTWQPVPGGGDYDPDQTMHVSFAAQLPPEPRPGEDPLGAHGPAGPPVTGEGDPVTQWSIPVIKDDADGDSGEFSVGSFASPWDQAPSPAPTQSFPAGMFGQGAAAAAQAQAAAQAAAQAQAGQGAPQDQLTGQWDFSGVGTGIDPGTGLGTGLGAGVDEGLPWPPTQAAWSAAVDDPEGPPPGAGHQATADSAFTHTGHDADYGTGHDPAARTRAPGDPESPGSAGALHDPEGLSDGLTPLTGIGALDGVDGLSALDGLSGLDALPGGLGGLSALPALDGGEELVADGHVPDGLAPDGHVPDGHVPDGLAPGELPPAGPLPDAVDGPAPDGLAPDPLAPDSGTAEADGDLAADEAEREPEPVEETHSEHPLASYVLRVNGADRPVTDAWLGESLLYVLRERLGLAGAKDGCEQGECGACSVQVDGRLVASCLVPAATAAGSEVRTVEGLTVDGRPSDVQRALAESGAVQCGFCIPGMAMTVHDLLEGNHKPTDLETRQALCGNLCRCSGYRGVLDAVDQVIAAREAAADDPDNPASAASSTPARVPHQGGPSGGAV
ncbi:2Fe-2S iron-sulfur cluster-binding protein [Streptomyces sp. NPDC088197]|uniref:2Fe-2S iron-sulfur cluster-binding protein n=1 Tax=Streptomyces sp. NPDC088197 TaxID=3365840 RepID=UPI0037F54907